MFTPSITTPTGITSPPPCNTKRPNNFDKTALFKLLPKRKLNLHPKTNHKTSTLHSSTVQNSSIPNYSIVNTTLNDNSLDNFLPIMIMTALSKYIAKQTILFLHHLLDSIQSTFSLQYSTLDCHLQNKKSKLYVINI